MPPTLTPMMSSGNSLRRPSWVRPEDERAYHSYKDWQKWRRPIQKRHGWIRQKGTRGIRGWEHYRDMISVLLNVSFDDLLANPNNQYFDFEPLSGDKDGRY